MKQLILAVAALAVFPASAFSADYTYKVADSCANGLTLTFSTAQQQPILDRYDTPLYKCTDLEAPQGPDDSGCRATEVIGETVGYKVQLGTLSYSNSLGQQSSGPMSILVYADLENSSGLTVDSLTYQLDEEGGSLDTLNSTWGDGLDEYEGTPLNPLPSFAGVQKSGNSFPALAGYADQVFGAVDSLNVYAAHCPNRVQAVKTR